MQQLQIPTVTTKDLSAFHHSHICQRSDPSACAHLCYTDQGGEEEEREGDGLGYYADGTKRTLTDEQVSMFRFSEIQGLLRQKRRRLAWRKSRRPRRGRHPSSSDDDDVPPHPPPGVAVVAPEATRRNRLEAALWAAKHDWDQFGNAVDAPASPREYVAEVQGDTDTGKTFLWPKIEVDGVE